MYRAIALACSLALLSPGFGLALGLREAGALRCDWAQNSSATWDDGRLEVSPGDGGMPSQMIDGIDREKGTALVSGNLGIDPVTLLEGAGSIHLLSSTATGNLVIVTIFDSWTEAGFPAVQSRHMRIGTDPIVSQTYGWCRPPGVQ